MPPNQTDKLPSGSQWLHDIKHDGFHIIARSTRSAVLLGAIPMATYWARVRVRAWTDTLRDCGFRDVRTSVMKIIWIIIGLGVALYLGGAKDVFIEHAGKFGTGIASLLLFFIILFSWNLLTAPAKLQQEADNEIAALKTKLNDREARQSAMARLWALRAEGTEMRNQKVVGANAAVEWMTRFENWHQRVLAEARTVSPNLHAWLATLDRVRPRTQYAALMPIRNSA